MNQELSDKQAGFSQKQKNQRSNCQRSLDYGEKGVPEKKCTSTSLSMLKPLTMDHNKLWKILKEMGIPDHRICVLRNLYAGQEATVRTGHRTADWFHIGKGVRQGCILSLCLFNICRAQHVKCWAG